MRHSLSKDTTFNGETTPRHTFLCSDSQCLPPGDPIILCAKHGCPITGKSFIEGIQKGIFSVKNGMCGVKGFVLGEKPPHIKLC